MSDQLPPWWDPDGEAEPDPMQDFEWPAWMRKGEAAPLWVKQLSLVLPGLALTAGIWLLGRAAAYPWHDMELAWATMIGMVVACSSALLLLLALLLRGWLRLPAGLLALFPLALGVIGLLNLVRD